MLSINFCLLILKSMQSNLLEGQPSMFCAHLCSLVLVHVYKRMYGSSHRMNEHLVAPGPVVEAMQ